MVQMLNANAEVLRSCYARGEHDEEDSRQRGPRGRLVRRHQHHSCVPQRSRKHHSFSGSCQPHRCKTPLQFPSFRRTAALVQNGSTAGPVQSLQPGVTRADSATGRCLSCLSIARLASNGIFFVYQFQPHNNLAGTREEVDAQCSEEIPP